MHARRWCHRVWFAPEPVATQHALRWLVLTTLAGELWRRRRIYRDLPERPADLWEPVSVLGWLPLGPPGSLLVHVLLVVAAVGIVASLAGLVPRLAAVLAAVAGAGLILLDNSFGKIDHDQQVLVIMAAVVAVSPVTRGVGPDSWRFRWPVQTCRLTLGLMLASAAAAKLVLGGPDWVLTANMRNILASEVLVFRDPPLGALALWIAAEPWRWKLAAAGTIAGEAALITAVFVRYRLLRAAAIAAGVGTIVGITLLIGLVGVPIVTLAAVFADPGRIVRRVRAGKPVTGSLAVTGAGLVVLAATAVTHVGWLGAAPIAAAVAAATAVTLRGVSDAAGADASRPRADRPGAPLP